MIALLHAHRDGTPRRPTPAPTTCPHCFAEHRTPGELGRHTTFDCKTLGRKK